MSEQGMTNITIAIRDEYIELYKLLKLANLAASGGEAKYMISEGMVRVNGEVETRKRRKVVACDTAECDGGRVTVSSPEK
jgi:ribosome-associated protein